MFSLTPQEKRSRRVRKIVYAGFEAGGMRELKYNSCRAKIIYPGIEAGKKYGLSMQGLKPVRKIDYAKV